MTDLIRIEFIYNTHWCYLLRSVVRSSLLFAFSPLARSRLSCHAHITVARARSFQVVVQYKIQQTPP